MSYNEFKDFVTKEFKTKGSYYKSKFTSRIEPDLKDGSLLERYLLVPVKDILETERWGYERYGINSASRPLDFDLSVDLKAYAEIKNFNVIPSSTIFMEGNWKPISRNEIEQKLIRLTKRYSYNKMNIICINKKSITNFLKYING